MGNLVAAATAEDGRPYLERLNAISNDVAKATSDVANLGRLYQQLRADIADTDDEALLDTRFATAATAAKQVLDGLPAEVARWVVQFFDGLGYVPKV